MKNIYIDCGCYNGDTIHYAKIIGADEVYAFDPISFVEWLKIPDVKFSSKAVWTFDGEISFYDMKSVGSTLIKEKLNAKTGDLIKVECFDFSKWLEQFRGDYVVVKMDIEGAEYEVLKKVIEDKNDDIINLLIVEFHSSKIIGVDYTKYEEIINKQFEGRICGNYLENLEKAINKSKELR